MVPEDDSGHHSGPWSPIHGEWEIQGNDHDNAMLDKEAPKHGVRVVPAEIRGNETLHRAGEAPAVGEFAEEGVSGQNSETGGQNGNVAEMKGKQVVEGDCEIEAAKNQLVDRKNHQTDECEECSRPETALSSGVNADERDEGNCCDGETMRGSKERHEGTVSDFFQCGQGIDRKRAFA